MVPSWSESEILLEVSHLRNALDGLTKDQFALPLGSNVGIPAITLVSFFSWSAQEASSCCNLACRKEGRLVIQQSENLRGPHSEMLSQRLSHRWLDYIRHDCRCLFDGGAKPSSILCSCLGTCFSKLSTSSIHQCCLHPKTSILLGKTSILKKFTSPFSFISYSISPSSLHPFIPLSLP